MTWWEWLNRSYKESVVAELLGNRAGSEPPRKTATTTAAPAPDVRVTAKIPPLAQYGSYAHHEGVDVFIDPPPGELVSGLAANEWIDRQLDYYDTHVVHGNLETSSGATRGQFAMRNVSVRDDGFSFRFQAANHPAGMPYAQLATFIEIMKGVPIIEVDTDRLEAIVKREVLNQ
jgi:hypothetical protein